MILQVGGSFKGVLLSFYPQKPGEMIPNLTFHHVVLVFKRVGEKKREHNTNYIRVLKGGGCPRGGGDWGTLRIRREDWGSP